MTRFGEGTSPELDPVYVESIMRPLAAGQGVACFVAEKDGSRDVLFHKHQLTEAAARYATDERESVRAAQAVAVQMKAREHARGEGYEVAT